MAFCSRSRIERMSVCFNFCFAVEEEPLDDPAWLPLPGGVTRCWPEPDCWLPLSPPTLSALFWIGGPDCCEGESAAS